MIKCNHCGNDNVVLNYGKPYTYHCYSCKTVGISMFKVIAAIKFYLGKKEMK